MGFLGKHMLNPEVIKCHEDLITLETYVQLGKTMDNNKFFICENINIFGGLGGGGGHVGPIHKIQGYQGHQNIQTGPILFHINPLFNNNLHVKYRSNLTS